MSEYRICSTAFSITLNLPKQAPSPAAVHGTSTARDASLPVRRSYPAGWDPINGQPPNVW